MDLGLIDKVAAITGGSAGIGLAVADGLAAEGVYLGTCGFLRLPLLQKRKLFGGVGLFRGGGMLKTI